MKTILQTCKELSSIGERYGDINSGGCACFAGMLSYNLQGIIDHKIVSSSRQDDLSDKEPKKDRDKVEHPDDVDSWVAAGYGFSHVWVQLTYRGREYAVDCNGVHRVEDMVDSWGVHTKGGYYLKDVLSWSLQEDAWNAWFDRRNLPMIEDMMCSIFHNAGYNVDCHFFRENLRQ